MSPRVRRSKPYVCVDCDFADHFRFQATKDLDVAAGAWLRCLAHTRAQEQDGRVTLAWLRRNFGGCFERIEELATVGLLHVRPDGDYELHAYAPRNQTRAMMDDDRRGARTRMRAARKGGSEGDEAAADVRTNACEKRSSRKNFRGALPKKCSPEDVANAASGERVPGVASPTAPSKAASSGEGDVARIVSDLGEMTPPLEPMEGVGSVTANKRACSVHPGGTNIAVTSALVPTSTSTSIYTSTSSSLSSPDLHDVSEIHGGHEGRLERGPGERREGERPEGVRWRAERCRRASGRCPARRGWRRSPRGPDGLSRAGKSSLAVAMLRRSGRASRPRRPSEEH